MTGLSQRLVNYIAGLTPLYTFQFADGSDCALSLIDGTLLMPVDETGADREEGWVRVLWQGDAHRSSEVPGPLLAYQAALRCAELHGVGQFPGDVDVNRQFLLARLREICGELPMLSPAVRAS